MRRFFAVLLGFAIGLAPTLAAVPMPAVARDVAAMPCDCPPDVMPCDMAGMSGIAEPANCDAMSCAIWCIAAPADLSKPFVATGLAIIAVMPAATEIAGLETSGLPPPLPPPRA